MNESSETNNNTKGNNNADIGGEPNDEEYFADPEAITSATGATSSDLVEPAVIEGGPEGQHLVFTRQYWRDMILGVNDGLIATFLLVTTVAGGGLPSIDILLTAMAGALAGAVSMSAGEFMATKSQNEVMAGELKLERMHIEKFRDQEMDELRTNLLPIIGISNGDLKDRLVNHYQGDPEALLKIMAALEFGVLDQEIRSPCKAALFSGMLFTAGAMPSILPFIFCSDPTLGLILAAVLTTSSLLVVGMVKTWASRGNCISAAVENLTVAAVGGAFAYGVGACFNLVVHK